MAKKIVTLFIGDTSINLLVMKGKQVDRWASLPLEPGLVSQGMVLDEVRVADGIKELFRLEKVTTRKVIVGVSGLNSLYRLLTLPELPEAILDEAVKHEARRVVPVSLDEVYLSYQSIPSPRGETRVFLVAFPRNVTDAVLRTLKLADIEPHIMDLAPLALCRILDEPRAIIVNARLEQFEIVVMADRLPEIIRSLSLPSEAESLSEKLPTIAEEFSRTVAFYNSSHLETPLDSTVPVFVCGELAQSPETWQSLVGRLNFPVSLLPSPVEYPEAFPVNEFAVNIGLALKSILREAEGANFSIINLNILPEVSVPRALPKALIYTAFGIVIGVGALVYMALLVQSTSADTTALRSSLALTNSSIVQQRLAITALEEQVELFELSEAEGKPEIEAEIESVAAEIELVEATADIFKARFTSLAEGRAEVDGDLSVIVNLWSNPQVPQNVDLTEINHGAASVTISGVAQDEAAIFEYARALRSSGRFPTVIISSIQEYVMVEGDEEEGVEEIKGFNFYFMLE